MHIPALRKQWELVIDELDIPTLSDFTDFLEKHCTSREVIYLSSIIHTSFGSFFIKSLPGKCCLCKGDHTIHRSSEFVQMSPQAHFSMAKDKQLCIICL
ncbi:hypothetical protein PR048_011632 [Dryococelus australis]|uniref:Uncharacterized protein n=1 Tax=Dryococelus australis TaxID=614101 RepID=A0ABQ9HM33_9NEOP|nr:hypothetical protein PR048_011632 [Dryococelus australis]